MDENKGKKEVDTLNYPSNSHKVRAEKEEPKTERKLEKIIKGNVVTKKKPLGKRFIELFFGADVSSVKSYILHDVLIPAAKDTFEDLVKGSVEVLVRGESKGSRTRRDKGKSYVSYNNYSKSESRDRGRNISQKNRARHNFDDIILESRGEAEEVLSQLVDLTIDYDTASVSDLYDLVGITPNFTDEKWGWDDLSSASISRVRDGYLINLPKTIQID